MIYGANWDGPKVLARLEETFRRLPDAPIPRGGRPVVQHPEPDVRRSGERDLDTLVEA